MEGGNRNRGELKKSKLLKVQKFFGIEMGIGAGKA